jgi:hypothetical protein
MNGLASAARRTAPITEDRPSSTHSAGSTSKVRGNPAAAENRVNTNIDPRRGPNTDKHAKAERKPRADGNGQDKEATYIGEIAIAEYERMKRENETMKKVWQQIYLHHDVLILSVANQGQQQDGAEICQGGPLFNHLGNVDSCHDRRSNP